MKSLTRCRQNEKEWNDTNKKTKLNTIQETDEIMNRNWKDLKEKRQTWAEKKSGSTRAYGCAQDDEVHCVPVI